MKDTIGQEVKPGDVCFATFGYEMCPGICLGVRNGLATVKPLTDRTKKFIDRGFQSISYWDRPTNAKTFPSMGVLRVDYHMLSADMQKTVNSFTSWLKENRYIRD